MKDPDTLRSAVNDQLSLTWDKNGLTLGTDSLLLASFIRGRDTDKAMELGAGTGILSMLVATRKKAGTILALEVQEKYAALAAQNARENGLSSRISVFHCDLRNFSPAPEEYGSYHTVFSNPPYMPADCGKRNASDDNFIARHEVFGDISDFCRIAAKMLRFKGRFYVVYRPDRLVDLLTAMRNHKLEPKRITFVLPSPTERPSLFLTEAVYGGKPSLNITPPLILYTDASHTKETAILKSVYRTGNLDFGEEFLS